MKKVPLALVALGLVMAGAWATARTDDIAGGLLAITVTVLAAIAGVATALGMGANSDTPKGRQVVDGWLIGGSLGALSSVILACVRAGEGLYPYAAISAGAFALFALLIPLWAVVALDRKLGVSKFLQGDAI